MSTLLKSLAAKAVAECPVQQTDELLVMMGSLVLDEVQRILQSAATEWADARKAEYLFDIKAVYGGWEAGADQVLSRIDNEFERPENAGTRSD